MSTQPPPQMMSYNKARDVLLALLSQIADEAQYWQAERDAELSGFVIENIDQVRNAILSALVLGDRCAQAEQQRNDTRAALDGCRTGRSILAEQLGEAEAEAARLREALAESTRQLELLKENYDRKVDECRNEFKLVQALTQERDTLRAELLERAHNT